MGAGKERVREGCKWVQARAQVERGSRAAREWRSRESGRGLRAEVEEGADSWTRSDSG